MAIFSFPILLRLQQVVVVVADVVEDFVVQFVSNDVVVAFVELVVPFCFVDVLFPFVLVEVLIVDDLAGMQIFVVDFVLVVDLDSF